MVDAHCYRFQFNRPTFMLDPMGDPVNVTELVQMLEYLREAIEDPKAPAEVYLAAKSLQEVYMRRLAAAAAQEGAEINQAIRNLYGEQAAMEGRLAAAEAKAAATAAARGTAATRTTGCIIKVVKVAGPWIAVSLAAAGTLELAEYTEGEVNAAAKGEEYHMNRNARINNSIYRARSKARSLLSKLDLKCSNGESSPGALARCMDSFVNAAGICGPKSFVSGDPTMSGRCLERAVAGLLACIEKACICEKCEEGK